MDYSQLDDATLMQMMAQGRTEALSTLYQRYSRLVYSLALAVVGDRATASDVALDVFTRLWQQAGAYRAEKGKVTTWLTAITRNLAIDRLRRRQARPEGNSVPWKDAPGPSVPGGRSVEEGVELSLERARVRAALRQLPHEQQVVLTLAYFKGLTHPEIAAALRQPLGTVKTRIRLGMQKLRHLLAQDAPDLDQSTRDVEAYHNDEQH